MSAPGLLVVDTLDRRTAVPYDSLIVSAGASQSYFGHPEFAVDAPGMKTIDHALELRGGSSEPRDGGAARATRRAAPLAHVRGGRRWADRGGARGAARRAVAPLAAPELPAHRPGGCARCCCWTQGPRSFPLFPEALRSAPCATSARSGSKFTWAPPSPTWTSAVSRQNSAVPELHRIEAATKIWAAGVQASPLGRLLTQKTGAEVDRAGRVKVEPDLTIPGHPELFVVGDLMSFDGLPGVAQVAIQSGQHAARTIARRVAGDTERRPFQYRDLGTMATISRFRALAVVGRVQGAGFGAWLLWLIVHVVGLTGFKNRVSALFNWTVAFSAAVVHSA